MADKVKIVLEGVTREVEAGKNLLQVVLDEGLVIPHFCYHEALGAVGSCRLCACQVAPGEDKPSRLEMTCMVRAAEGMIVNVNEAYAKNFRRQVIEDLMLNHPHDCPVCDEGGECMLQDMTVLSEHQHRRNRFGKRTWHNQNLGPLIHHEMNRCITCYRCVRYYREYALGDDLGVFGSRDRVYFGRVEEGTLESEFAGNLLDVCPTGVFTNKRFKENYTRPWDLLTARSVCVNCSVGCNVLPGHRHNTLRRIKPVGNSAVNKFFMCDRGRFGGEFVNLETRLTAARVRGTSKPLEQGIQNAAAELKSIVERFGPESVAGLGSARASMEANAALALMLKGLGSTRVAYFDNGDERAAVRRAAALTTSGDVPIASLPEMETADFVLILGGDLTGEAPMMDLSVRQAIRAGSPVYVVSPRAGALDGFARASLRTVPGEEAQIASFIASVAADVEPEEDNFVQQAGKAFHAAKKPLILCSACHGDAALVDSAFELARKMGQVGRACRLAYLYPGANSVGVGLIKQDEAPESIYADVQGGRIKALVVLERDLSASGGTADALMASLGSCEMVLVIDSLEHQTTLGASTVLPCVSHYQSFGTFLNFEGRGQRFDGLQFSGPVMLAASEVLVSLIQQADLDEAIGGTDFHDVYEVSRDSSRALDNLPVHAAGALVRSTARPAEQSSRTPRKAEGELHRWNVIHTFGSEYLSALSPPVAELAPAPYLEIHPDEAGARGFTEGENTDVLGVRGPVKFNDQLARGTVAVPVLHTSAAIAAAVAVS